eukprot:jgi/Undpi1/11314/HiC_scaffold_30.g13612.m1
MPRAWPSLAVGACLLARNEAFISSGGVLTPAKDYPKRSLSRRADTRRQATRRTSMAGDEPVDSKVKPTSADPNLGVKAAWYGSELFGNFIGMGNTKPIGSKAVVDPTEPIGRTDAIARLKTDFDRFYFVTGQMDLDLYEEDCTFADPFVAFDGRQRFKNNLDNLGSLMQDVNLDVTSWEETNTSLKTKWRFRCVLGLPWKPTLAAAGGTEFFFNEDSGRIERHVESWEIEPIDALKQLIRPGRKKSTG